MFISMEEIVLRVNFPLQIEYCCQTLQFFWQMERILHNLRQYETPLEKYVDIMDLQVQLNSCHCLCLQPSLPNLACTSLSRLCTLSERADSGCGLIVEPLKIGTIYLCGFW
jgi:hypothetical protein